MPPAQRRTIASPISWDPWGWPRPSIAHRGTSKVRSTELENKILVASLASLLLVVRPGAPSSVLAPSGDARSP